MDDYSDRNLWCDVINKALDDLQWLRDDMKFSRDHDARMRFMWAVDAYNFFNDSRRLKSICRLVDVDADTLKATVMISLDKHQHKLAKGTVFDDSLIEDSVPQVQA